MPLGKAAIIVPVAGCIRMFECSLKPVHIASIMSVNASIFRRKQEIMYIQKPAWLTGSST